MLVHRLRHAFISDYQKDTTFFYFPMLGTFGIQVNKKAKIQLLFFEREL